MKADILGDKLKSLENRWRSYLPLNSYVVMRIDGKSFSSFTKDYKKPFDDAISYAMRDTTLGLCEQIDGAVCAYTQSDEISILLTDKKSLTTQPWFGNNLNKLVSVSASLATSLFNQALIRYNWSHNSALEFEEIFKFACFDSRVFTVPTEQEVLEYFQWRQDDCIRNSISVIASTFYSHEQLMNKSTSERLQMLKDKHSPWESYPMNYRFGSFFKKKMVVKDVSFTKPNGEEIPNVRVERAKWTCLDAPSFYNSPEELTNLLEDIKS